MRSLPATGRRLLQAISTGHVRSVLSAGPLTTARLAPAKALASGAAVVAAGALLIPTGQAIAQTAQHDGAAAAASTLPQAAELRALVTSSHHDEQDQHAEQAKDIEQADGVKTAVATALGQSRAQDAQASRSEDRIALPTEQAPAAAEQTPAQAPAAAEQPAAEPAAPAQPAPAAEQPAAPAEQAAPAAQPVAAPAPAPAPEPAKPDWSSPAPGASISNPFHRTNAAYAAGYHTGTDFAVSVGTPVLAVGDSTVVSAGWAGAYGNQIVLKLSDGRFAQYAHLSQLGVSAGQHVSAGQQVGKSGNTGNSHGPHLHFEIRTANQYAKVIDPIAYLKGHGADNF